MTKRAIYAIVDSDADKFYIGSAEDIDRRIYSHKNDLKKGVHQNFRLQKAFDKGNRLEVFCAAVDEEADLLQVEQSYLDEFFPTKKLYNIATSATAPMKGLKHSPEIIEKMRESQKKFRLEESPEQKERRRQSLLGNKFGLGCNHSKESIEKRVQTRRENYENNPEAQKRHSQQIRANWQNPEYRENLVQKAKQRGHCPTPEALEKARLTHIRSVTVHGVIYESGTLASQALGISPQTLYARVNNSGPNFKDYTYS